MNRLFYSLAVLAMVAVFAFMPTQSVAQVYTVDTVSVAALPAGNINTVINSDTLAGSVRAHPNRVYKLTRGSVYQVTEPIKAIGSLHILAPNGTTRPPVLAPAILPDNSSIDHFFELRGKGATVDIRNMYILSVRADQAQLGWSDAMRIYGDSTKITLRGVVFDAFSAAGIRVYYRELGAVPRKPSRRSAERKSPKS